MPWIARVRFRLPLADAIKYPRWHSHIAHLSLMLALAFPLDAQGMKGDTAAITLARRLIERMGGAEQWSKANWIYARERASYAQFDSTADAEFWRRTDAPAQWVRVRSAQIDRLGAWTATSGWDYRDGQLTVKDRAAMQSVLGWWPGEIYVMYVRLARNDPKLRLVASPPRSFTVLDDDTGENLGEFHVSASGELVRWVRRHGTNAVDYIYGPLKQFGPIRVPDWGALTSGAFRFYYTDFRLSERAPADISFTPPNR